MAAGLTSKIKKMWPSEERERRRRDSGEKAPANYGAVLKLMEECLDKRDDKSVERDKSCLSSFFFFF